MAVHKKACPMTTILVILTVFPVLFSTCTLFDETTSGDPKYSDSLPDYFYLEIESTSDWCNLLLTGENFIRKGIITNYSEGSETVVQDQLLALYQNLEMAEEGQVIVMEALIGTHNENRNIDLRIKKGCLGSVNVRFYRAVEPVAELLAEFSCEGEEGTSEEHMYLHTVELVESSDAPTPEDLSYPVEELEEQLQHWIEGITEFTYPSDSLYWDDAIHILAISPDVYETSNAVTFLRDEIDRGPDPSIDYSLIEFMGPMHIPTDENNMAKILFIDLYDDSPSGSDLFLFEERENTWKISRQFWKFGFDRL